MARASAAARGIPSATCREPIDGPLCEFGLAWSTGKRRAVIDPQPRRQPYPCRHPYPRIRGITSASRAKPEALCPFYRHRRLTRRLRRERKGLLLTLSRRRRGTPLETKIRLHLGYARYGSRAE